MAIQEFAFVLVLMVTSVVYGCDDSDTWTHKTFLDENNDRVFMQWKPGKETITIKVTGETKGWLGIGFSPNSEMAESDIALGWVTNGKGYLQDRHGSFEQNEQLPIDKQQDLELLTSSENATHTTLCFRRKLDTCDQEDIAITNNTMTIIWAMNPEDPTDPNDSSIAKTLGPNDTGEKEQDMLSDVYPKPTTNDIKTWTVQVPNITVPKNLDTLFYCQFFMPPKVTKKQHVIGYGIQIQKENMMNVHHFAINECTGDGITDQINDINFNEGFACDSDDKPAVANNCHKHLILWTAGDVGNIYPPHVGLPFAIYDGKPLLYLINVHYNNPDMKEIHDSSFLQVYYTDKLRKNEAAMLTFGYTIDQPYQIIPPKQENWINVAHCAPDCLQKTFQVQKFKAFSVVLHGHNTTRKIVLRHFRNKTELPPIAENDNYSAHYQQARIFKDIEIRTTDQLTVECTRDTTNRTQITTGGQAAYREMCIAFILYYPRSNLTNCFSNLPLTDLGSVTAIKEFYPASRGKEVRIKEPSNLANETFRDYLQNLQLSQSQINTLQQMELTSDKIPVCGSDYKSDTPMNLQPINYPKDFSPYIQSNVCDNNNKQRR